MYMQRIIRIDSQGSYLQVFWGLGRVLNRV